MKTLKKFSVSNVSGKMSDKMLKTIYGGYSGSGVNCFPWDIEMCECDKWPNGMNCIGSWMQCRGANVGSWACSGCSWWCVPCFGCV